MTKKPSSCNNTLKKCYVLLQADGFIFTVHHVDHLQFNTGGNCPMTKKIISLTLSLFITTACLAAVPQISEAAPHRGPAMHHHIYRPPRPPVRYWGPPPPPPPKHRVSRADRAAAAAIIIAAILSGRWFKIAHRGMYTCGLTFFTFPKCCIAYLFWQ